MTVQIWMRQESGRARNANLHATKNMDRLGEWRVVTLEWTSTEIIVRSWVDRVPTFGRVRCRLNHGENMSEQCLVLLECTPPLVFCQRNRYPTSLINIVSKVHIHIHALDGLEKSPSDSQTFSQMDTLKMII